MKTTGQILKENREKKGITLNEVALATKINVKMLSAIEEGQIDKLPTKTFLRGFVRSYARYLGLDEDAILNAFYEEMGSTKPKLNVTAEAPTAPQTAAEARSSNAKALDPGATNMLTKVGAVVAILSLVVLIVVFKKKMESYENEAVISELPKEIEAVNTDGEAPTDPTAATPSPTPDPSAAAAVAATASPTPTPTATPSPTPTASPTATPTSSPSPTPSPTPTATPSPTPTPKSSPTPTPSPSPTPTVSPTATPIAGKSHEIIVEAMAEVEVDAQVDSEPPRKIKLTADQVQTFKAKRKVVLRLSNGGAVNLIVNGTDRGVPGDLGKPAKVDLP